MDGADLARGLGSLSPEDGLALLSVLFASPPEGMAFIDPDFVVRAANESYARQVGIPRDEIVGHITEELFPGWTEQVGHLYRQVRETGEPYQSGEHPYRFLGRPDRGATYWDVSISPVQRPKGAFVGYLLLHREVTERKRTEEELAGLVEQLKAAHRRAQFEQARWQAVVENMVDPLAVGDTGGNATYMNPAYARLVGGSLQEDLPLEAQAARYRQYHPEGTPFKPAELPLRRAALREEEVRNVEIWEGTSRENCRVSLWNAAPLRDEEGRVMGSVAVGRDVTEQRRVEEERRQLLARLATVQEEERRRVSRELHDQMGQHIAALMLGLRALRDSVPEQAASIDLVKQLEGIAGELGQEAHRLALELRPTALDDLGLEVTLLNYAEEWAERSGVEVDCQIPAAESVRLPSRVETALYRMVQEALTNVLKHAAAKQVCLILKRRDGRVVAIVEDDGCGFDVEAEMRSQGPGGRLGLLGIQERVASLGGTLQIESSPGAGTTLFVAIPFSPAQEAFPDV